LDSCRQDPILASVKLIAEPWDCGPGGYQVGGFPPGWAEWNDRFRDTVRAWWKGDEGKAADLATRLAASADKFNRRGR
ncbi:glycogen debranching enzyme GlgX, partial [Pseudomonas sp. SIMBA_041]